jgi:deoxyribodipyrimidine photo-lyase
MKLGSIPAIQTPVNIHWFRRDLRLYDNTSLFHALNSPLPVLCVFIFDTQILSRLEDKDDRRVNFIYQKICEIKNTLEQKGSSLLICHGEVTYIWTEIAKKILVKNVYTNSDYEPSALERDMQVKNLLSQHQIGFHSYKDHVIFEKSEIQKDDCTPYTVFTPYSKKWKATLNDDLLNSYPSENHTDQLYKTNPFPIAPLAEIGFIENKDTFPAHTISQSLIKQYHTNRDFPAVAGTSKLGVHFRFGTISIRQKVRSALQLNETFLNELIWREFYIQIMWHFPHVVHRSFKPAYDQIKWLNDETLFNKWCEGATGIPIVDAGMRELKATGFMHNRVRMITASFLTKNLLIDWRWGEAWFAQKLLDFELASNNGGWQWAAGCGTDAAPYFRIFSPVLQTAKFDPELKYIKKWVPEYETSNYPPPIVDLPFSRDRCLKVYKLALEKSDS